MIDAVSFRKSLKFIDKIKTQIRRKTYMSNFVENNNAFLLQPELKDELRELIQEEIWKAFDVAMKAAANPPIQLHKLNDDEFQVKRKIQKQMVQEISRAVKSALNHLKAEAQARVVEKTDSQRAERIRALADPSF